MIEAGRVSEIQDAKRTVRRNICSSLLQYAVSVLYLTILVLNTHCGSLQRKKETLMYMQKYLHRLPLFHFVSMLSVIVFCSIELPCLLYVFFL